MTDLHPFATFHSLDLLAMAFLVSRMEMEEKRQRVLGRDGRNARIQNRREGPTLIDSKRVRVIQWRVMQS